MPTIIGIDLGTTYSLSSILMDGVPKIIPNALGEALTPSAVSLTEAGAVLVGAPARARATTHPTLTALAFKRDMGTARTVTLGSRTFTPQELSALVLQTLKHDAEVALGHAIDEAVVTVPAYFGDAQRQATRDAGAIAGLKVERIINEPTAAALAYGLHERSRELKAVVVDLGGGTFDVTVLEILEGVIEIQSSSGDMRLGGDDFDRALADAVASVLDLDLANEPRSRARLKAACELAKKRLAERDVATILVPELAAGKRKLDVAFELTRARAEEIWAPLIARLRAPIQRALRDARLTPAQIDEVLLVGGSTRMPLVAQLTTDLFGRSPLRSLPPDEAVALGAAVQAGLKAGDAALADMVVTDVAPFSLGVSTAHRSERGTAHGLFTPVLERGTVIPASREATFQTIEDNQRELRLGVYQGEHALVRDNTKLGELTITGLRAAPAGEETVRVRFTYDLNGILEVDTTVTRTGKTKNLVIEGHPGRLTAEQIQAARKAMAHLKIHPREALPNATALARADALYVELTGAARVQLAQGIAEFHAALDSQDDTLIASERQRLVRLLAELSGGEHVAN